MCVCVRALQPACLRLCGVWCSAGFPPPPQRSHVPAEEWSELNLELQVFKPFFPFLLLEIVDFSRVTNTTLIFVEEPVLLIAM